MQAFAQTADAVAATTKKLEKVRLVAEYFRSRPVDEAAQAAVFLSGRAFPHGRRELYRLAAPCYGAQSARYPAKEKLRLPQPTVGMAILARRRRMFWSGALPPKARCL